MNGDRKIVRHFSYDDLRCKCGDPLCEGLPPLSKDIMEFLFHVSVLYDIIPFRNISFYRCPLHRLYRKESGHSMCLAMDIIPLNGFKVSELYVIAESHFFNGMGINTRANSLHIDKKGGRVARWKYVKRKPEYLFIWRRK